MAKCPMNGMNECLTDCAWRVDDRCAMFMIVNELYHMVECAGGGEQGDEQEAEGAQ